MTSSLKQWLKQQLMQVVSVKACRFGQDMGISVSDPVRPADMIVHTWAGIDVHIHLIDKPLNVRTIRRIVENATKIGVSTLFLVDLKLLPKNGERAAHDQWYLAIHALIDRLYAYHNGGGEPFIGQVNFTPVGRTTELETHYGSKIAFGQLRCFRNSVKPSIMKGYWMVADFGSNTPQPQSPPGYSSNGRTTYAEPQRTRQQHTSPPSSNGANNRPPPRPSAQKTKLDTCYELLGVQRSASREEVKTAFRKLARVVHPDVSELPKAEAELRFKALSAAYEYIRTAQGW